MVRQEGVVVVVAMVEPLVHFLWDLTELLTLVEVEVVQPVTEEVVS
jgi:hypothetical protein